MGGNKNLYLDDSVVEAEELEKKRLLDACSAVQTTTIERNSSKYRVDAKRMYRKPKIRKQSQWQSQLQ